MAKEAKEKAAKLAAKEQAHIKSEALVDKSELLKQKVIDIRYVDTEQTVPDALKEYDMLIQSIRTGQLSKRTLTASLLTVNKPVVISRDMQGNEVFDFHNCVHTTLAGIDKSFYYVYASSFG